MKSLVRGSDAAPSEEGAAVKSLGEKLGGASSEEEATRWASLGCQGGGGPEGSLPGWRPGDSACACSGMVSWRGSEEPSRGGPSHGLRRRDTSEEGLWRRSPVGLPGVPPRRSVGDDPVRGSGAASSEEGAAVKSLGEGLLAAPSEEGAAGWPLWGATVEEGPRVLCQGGAPVSGLGEGVAGELSRGGSEEPLGESARGGQGVGGAPRSSPSHGPRDLPRSLRGGGGGVLQPWLKAGRARLQGIELDRESVLPARGG
jgi:hypothetical protein